MRSTWLLTCLAGFLAFSALCGAAADEVEAPRFIFPFIQSGDGNFIPSPYFEGTFLDYLEGSGVDAVMDSDGKPLIYYSENGGLGCTGFCDTISMNGFTFGSKTTKAEDIPSGVQGGDSVVAGSDGTSSFLDNANAIRLGLMDNPAALDEFEKYLLEQEEGYLQKSYNEELGDAWSQALSGIKADPSVYGRLLQGVRSGDLQGAVSALDDYIGENFDVNGAYDMLSLYSALDDGMLGNVQAEELMRGILDKVAQEEGTDIDLSNLDMMSDIIGSDEFKRMADRAAEVMDENPEMFDKLGDLANEMLETPQTREVLKNAIREAMENGDWESVRKLMDVFSKMENKDELMKALMDGIAEHMRDMMESGQMDKLMEIMNDPVMKDMLSKAAQAFSQSMLDEALEWIRETPPELAYVVALAAIIATLLILVKLKM